MKNSVQILNLGCGEITHPRFVNVDNDIVLKLKAWGFIPVKSTGQQKRLRSDVTFLDISKGLPFKDESFDIVFHSHVLEHIPFDQRDSFMAENFRLIKKGGALRMVIPDLELKLREIIAQIDNAAELNDFSSRHEESIYDIYEQSVRTVPRSYDSLNAINRFFASTLLGDSRRRGELHLMMYTKLALRNVLMRHSFVCIEFTDAYSSTIPGWTEFRIELDSNGNPLYPGSIYVEAKKL